MHNLMSHQRNVAYNHNEILLQAHQNGYNDEDGQSEDKGQSKGSAHTNVVHGYIIGTTVLTN